MLEQLVLDDLPQSALDYSFLSVPFPFQNYRAAGEYNIGTLFANIGKVIKWPIMCNTYIGNLITQHGM